MMIVRELRKTWATRKWRALMHAADAARDSGNKHVAAHLYRAITQAYPERFASWTQLGNMSKDLGQIEVAEAAYTAALSIRPNDDDIYLQLGHLYKVNGMFSKAAHHYALAAGLNPLSHAADELAILSGNAPGSQLEDLDLPERAATMQVRLATAFAARAH